MQNNQPNTFNDQFLCSVQELTDHQMAGQRLMVGFEGTAFGRDLEFLIGGLKVGGIILFAQNIEDPAQLRRLCRDMQEYAQSLGQPPLFIAIDQEGGTVARLRKPAFREFPPITELSTLSAAETFSRDMADQLSALGINMNMAPVMDVAPDNFESIMKQRVFGSNPRHVAAMGRVVIEQHQNRRIMAVAKHFPGIGRTTLDSHLDLPEFDAAMEDLAEYDLIPFQAAIEAAVAGIMLSHIRYTAIDPCWPASLSPAIARDLLRKKMGYTGLVMTDDLDMGAVKNYYSVTDAIGQMIESDVDLALICHKGPDIQTAFHEILHRITDDPRIRVKGMTAVSRIMACKNRFLRS
jgi:beta-N-acetylhexosaminidase